MYTDSGGSTFTSTLVIFLLFLRTIAAVQVGETRALPTAVWTGISPVTNDFELLFLCLLGHLRILFGYTFQRALLILSLDWLFVFFCWLAGSFKNISWIWNLHYIQDWKMLPSFCSCLSLSCSSLLLKVLYFDVSLWSFMSCAVIAKNPLSNLSS